MQNTRRHSEDLEISETSAPVRKVSVLCRWKNFTHKITAQGRKHFQKSSHTDLFDRDLSGAVPSTGASATG